MKKGGSTQKNNQLPQQAGTFHETGRPQIEEEESVRFGRIGKIGKWFQILCLMNIPVFGFLYMLVKLIWRKTPREQRYFAAACLIYKLLVILLAVTILYVLYQIGLDFVDTILKYAERMQRR